MMIRGGFKIKTVMIKCERRAHKAYVCMCTGGFMEANLDERVDDFGSREEGQKVC